MVKIMDIRDLANTDVLDYQQLISSLREYAKPRDRIGALLADGSLVRVRKGLYVLGERYRRSPLSREVLANLVSGPSADRFVRDKASLALWSREFFLEIVDRIEILEQASDGVSC